MGRRRTILGMVLVTLCCAPLVAAVVCRAAQPGTDLRIGGNGSGLGAMKLLALAYQKLHPEVSITVLPNLGSSGGIAALRQGALDLAVSSRPLKAGEQGDGVHAVEYARSPFLFAAHRGVSKTDMTTSELIALYRQDTLRWPDGTRVRLILRPQNDNDTALVQQISPELARAVPHAHSRPGMVIAVTDQECLDDISRMPGAFGGTALTQITTERRAVREFSFNGVAPTLKNLAGGSYPLVKKFYLVTGDKSSPQARQFAQFLHSSRAREILRNSGNLPHEGRER